LKTKNLIKFAGFLFLIVGLVFLEYYFQLSSYINAEKIRTWVASFGIWSPLVFIVLYAVSLPLLIPASPFSVVAGGLFGPYLGTLYTITGATLGASLAFILARFFGKSFVKNYLEEKFSSIQKINNKLEDFGFTTILLIRLIPIFPFTAASFSFGLTKMKFSHFFFGTLLGSLPGTFAYVSLGSGLATFNFTQLAIAVGLIIILSLSVYIYKNMSKQLKSDEFDIIVVGAGAAGLNIASFMNKVGLDVLLIEQEEDRIGGDCLNFGCVPSKSLIHVAREVQSAQQAKEFGLESSGKIDFSKVKDYIQDNIEQIREHENKEYLEEKGITVKIGQANFVGENEVEIAGEKFKADKIILATGARPRQLDIPGGEDVKIHDNESIWEIEELPDKMIIIGGGFVGLELAQAFQYLGSEVHLFERGERVLKPAPKEISKKVEENLQESGVTIHKQTSAKKFADDSLVVEQESGEAKEVDFDLIFASIGRIANTDGIGLDRVGVETTERGKLITDNYLRTTNKNIYACGDVVGQHQFTHATELHASIILKNLFSPLKSKLNTDHISWTMFTDPEVTVFGLSQDKLEQRGVDYEILENDFSEDDRAIIEGYSAQSQLKLFVDSKDKIRGGYIIAPNSGEIAQELILANTEGLTVDQLFNKTYPYPTASRVNKNTIAGYMSKKLTDFKKKVLRSLYKIF
jgi:pyruvate/2-oxoglutarate dehydrogenase complex dihydrolipoamide dehydrogenase (E3) component/uncharacterized membrane protein YdjX (TVP38/TMEM64 family)